MFKLEKRIRWVNGGLLTDTKHHCFFVYAILKYLRSINDIEHSLFKNIANYYIVYIYIYIYIYSLQCLRIRTARYHDPERQLGFLTYPKEGKLTSFVVRWLSVLKESQMKVYFTIICSLLSYPGYPLGIHSTYSKIRWQSKESEE